MSADKYPSIFSRQMKAIVYINKQLLDGVEHDIMNYKNRGLCYLSLTQLFDV